MRLARARLYLAVCAAIAVFFGCGSDDDDGSAGTGAAAGADASAGSGGASGQSGGGGQAGTLFAGGSAGAAAVAGVAGSSGAGGSSADAAADGDAAVDATDATDAADGTAGSGGSPGFKKCAEKCASDADCTGPSGSHVCDQFGRCRSANGWSMICANDSDCIAQSSNWTTHCKTNADCIAASHVCVNIGGGIGKCAPTGTAPLCLIAPQTFDMPLIDGSGNVQVCGDATGLKCHPVLKQCVVACTTTNDCSMVSGSPTCTNNLCGCSSNSDCVATGFCNTTSAYCGCDQHTDCPASNPICAAGSCGCNSSSDCPKLYAGSTVACE